jgi:hypothetical protein
MKKIVPILSLMSLLALLLSPAVVLGQAIPTEPTKCVMRGDYTGFTTMKCPGVGVDCPFNSTDYDCGACCLLDAVYKVSYWIFYIVIIIAFIFIVLGAFNIITAGGAVEKVNTGRSYIIYAIAGIIVALVARSIPNIAMAIMGLR